MRRYGTNNKRNKGTIRRSLLKSHGVSKRPVPDPIVVVPEPAEVGTAVGAGFDAIVAAGVGEPTVTLEKAAEGEGSGDRPPNERAQPDPVPRPEPSTASTRRVIVQPSIGIKLRAGSSSSGEGQTAKIDPAFQSGGLTDQVIKNLEAHRRKRWFAFWSISVFSAAFFGLLWFAIFNVFKGHFLTGVLGAASANWSWHILVFLGAALVILAAVPLSLTMGIVKMISEKENREEGGGEGMVKSPFLELAKQIADLSKAVVSFSSSKG